MRSRRLRYEMSLLLAIMQDAVRLSKTCWQQQPAAPGAPLAVRLAAFQGAMLVELRRAFRGLEPLPVEAVALLILKGVVEAGEDVDVVEAASGIVLR